MAKGARSTDGLTVYGIKACDTMKKTRAWLEAHGHAYAFHDYKTAGIERERIEAWIDKVGWEVLVNRAGTTFRKLPESDKQGLNQAKAVRLMLAHPSLIKRPVIEAGGDVIVGFKPEVLAAKLGDGR
jgi:arsenate reductase